MKIKKKLFISNILLKEIKKDKALEQVLIYIVLALLFLIENIFITGKYNMHSRLDDIIPFIPLFVIPYFMWYLFLVVTVIYYFKYSKEDLRKTFLSINLCMITAMVIYIVFPNYQSLRPNTYGGDFFSQWVRLLQIGDSASSVCPSLHVAVSISLYAGVVNSPCFRNKTGVKIFTFILTILICLSTIFIKQHSVVDVAAGAILSMAAYIYVYKIKGNVQVMSDTTL